jgi:hypothetical protein
MQCYLSKKISSGMHRGTQNLVGEVGVLVIQMPGKMVPEYHSSLHPSEKELVDWRSSAFHYRATPGYMDSMSVVRESNLFQSKI